MDGCRCALHRPDEAAYEETYVTCKTYEEVADAIRTMIVRGAPAIGVAAAMGVALGVRDSQAKDIEGLQCDLARISDVLASTRPTAVNLFWAIRRCGPSSKTQRPADRPDQANHDRGSPTYVAGRHRCQ